jgi:hypothetical protein
MGDVRQKVDDKPFVVHRECDHQMTNEELFWACVYYTRRNMKVVKRIIKVIENKGRISCPFPVGCNGFPCDKLVCDADELSNGSAFRRS